MPTAIGQHEHDFEDCGWDEQQCDSACRAESHPCSLCGKSRQEAAKDLAQVRAHIDASVQKIVAALVGGTGGRTLGETAEALKQCSKELDWLSREQLVEMAVWNERK
jgi:hypothetical protein